MPEIAGLEPAYKQHAVVDDVRGVIVDVEVTAGQTNEGQVIIERIDAAAATTGRPVKTVTADAGYAYGKVYGDLERRGIDPVIPAKTEPIRGPVPFAAVPIRCQARHTAMSARQNLAANPAGRARPLLLFQGPRLLALFAGLKLLAQRPRQ